MANNYTTGAFDRFFYGLILPGNIDSYWLGGLLRVTWPDIYTPDVKTEVWVSDSGTAPYVLNCVAVEGSTGADLVLDTTKTWWVKIRVTKNGAYSGFSMPMIIQPDIVLVGYFVKNGGNDALDGRSDATAWETLDKVNATAFVPGDHIYLKRGDTFRGTLIMPSSGTAGNDIVVDCYGAGNKPVILGSKDVSAVGDWVNHAGNVWKTTATLGALSAYVGDEDMSNLVFNNDASYGVRKLQLADLAAQGDWFYNVADNLCYLYSAVNPGTHYAHIEAAGVYGEVNVRVGNLRHHITIRNINTKYSGNHGIYIDRAHDVLIELCDVSWIGGWMAFADRRQGNGIGIWTEAARTYNITVRRNTVNQCYDAGISPQGASVQFDASNIRIHYNLITNCHYSFETWSGSDDTMTDVEFTNNTCINAGFSWSYAQRPDGGNDCDVIMWTANGIHNNVAIKNNIFSSARNKSIQLNMINYSMMNFDYNIYHNCNVAVTNAGNFNTLAQWQAQSGQESHSLSSDPLFIGGGDYHLQAGSPAINTGDFLGFVFIQDLDGVTVGNPPCIGCYEA